MLYTDTRVQFAAIDDRTEHGFPAEARDFIEEWMYRITKGDELVQPWSNPDMAVMALPILLDMGAGPLIEFERDPMLALLRGAVKSLTTKRERREFLRDTDESDAEDEKESDIDFAFLLMCDAKARRGYAREKARDRRELLALLDSIEEGGGDE